MGGRGVRGRGVCNRAASSFALQIRKFHGNNAFERYTPRLIQADDFDVWTARNMEGELGYMHRNPAKPDWYST